jgi:thiamine biosynthesis lipoprotein
MMNKKLLFPFLAAFVIMASCRKAEPKYENFTGFIQGTTFNIVYENDGSLTYDSVRRDVADILRKFDKSLSLYMDSSILSKVNRNEPVVLDSFFIEVFNMSAELSKMTDGKFDVTVAPLVRAWGFGPDEKRNYSKEKIDSLLKLVGMDKVSIVNGRLVKTDPRVSLDFNAIAQGYSVDVVCRYFDGIGVKNYLVEIGGEVRVKGEKAGKPWRVGIDKPEDYNMVPGQDLEAIVSIEDKAIATSGNYRSFYLENGIKYSHTIDPKTGYPAKNQLLSASIVADNCGLADGVATACMVGGKDWAIDFIQKHKLDGYLIYSDETGSFKTWTSENLVKNIAETPQQ